MSIRNRHCTGKLTAVFIASGITLAGCGGGGGGDSDDGVDRGDGSADVRGIIEIAAGNRVDGDYADRWADSDNDWPAGSRAPVLVPVPSTTGGYLSSDDGTYPNGLEYPGDRNDSYEVALVAGDRYFLQCFPSGGGEDTPEASMTLSLDPDNPVACGEGGRVYGTSGNATFTISANSGGPFRYVLTIAPQGSLTAANVNWPEPPLRVDEAIVTGSGAASAMSSSGLRASSVMDMERSIGPDAWQVRRKSGAGALSATSMATQDARAETIEWIKGVRDEFGLKVEPNYLFRLNTVDPEDNDYYRDSNNGVPNNWNLTQIRMPEAWDQIGLGGPWGGGIGVAVMDTGLFSTSPNTYDNWHPDLADNVLAQDGQLDFVSADYDVDDEEGRDDVPGTPITPENPAGTSFHGTHVAGIVAALDNSIGTVGIAHEATIFPYRVLGVDPVDGEDGTGAASDLIAAINDATDRTIDSGRADVDVINLSLGGLPQIDALQEATDRAYENDILVVAAAGNSGDGSAIYPAAQQRVVGVGATDRTGGLASYSNYGRSVDLLAPGGALTEGIVNAYGDVSGGSSLSADYAYLAGSSMATPHVAGVYALMKSGEDITPAQFRARLIAGLLTTKDGPAGPDALNDFALFGEGLLDAESAMNSTGKFPTVVAAWPRVVELSPSGSESRVLLEVLKKDGSVDPYFTGEPEDYSPFTVTDDSGDPIEAGEIPEAVRISVDLDEAEGRGFSRNITIPYSNGTDSDELVIPVYVQAADPPGERNAGRHYVLLLDADDFDSDRSRQIPASYSDGQYQFAIDDVAPGDYILVAGTDLDNNGYICENGEACAEYPETGARERITIGDGDTPQLEMTTSFRRPTLSEMGLPRYGFRGYPIPGHQRGTRPDRSLAP